MPFHSGPQISGAGARLRYSSAADEVNHQYNQCHYQQQVNQAAGDVETETQKPQNQKHDENCPKHVEPPAPIRASKLIYLVPAGASVFPHSKQDVLKRGVINPQKGHILDDAKPRADGLSDDNKFETEALSAANRLRNRSRARSRVLFITALPGIQVGRSGPTILYNIAHKEGVGSQVSGWVS